MKGRIILETANKKKINMKSKKTNETLLTDIFDIRMINGDLININQSNSIKSISTTHNDSIERINELVKSTGDTVSNGVNLSTNQPKSKYNLITTQYVTGDNIYETPIATDDSIEIAPPFSPTFPLFFKSQYSKFIPNKIKRTIEKNCSEILLREINPNKETAVELCLIFISNLSNAYYEETGGWKTLLSTTLQEQVSDSKEVTYLKIIDLLLAGTKMYGPIIQRSSRFTIGQESYRYRLTDTYRDKGVRNYDFKTSFAKNLLSKQYFKQLNIAIENPISNNLIKIYQRIDIPSVEEIKAQGKILVKLNHTTKKGKKLTFLNKHPKSYWRDSNNRSFVEENVELFLRLTSKGFLIPMVGDSASGGRVVDSFTLMPSWIRNMCKIDGHQIQEADYSALHPNIAMNIYKGNSEFVTHDKVAEKASIDKKTVKLEHLSFFNKTWSQMYKSPLFDFYSREEPLMMENMFRDKDMFGHKITSKKMFKVEVDIMTSVINKLNSEGIYVGYVYDALFCTPKNKQRVTDVMNEIILIFGVKTTAK